MVSMYVPALSRQSSKSCRKFRRKRAQTLSTVATPRITHFLCRAPHRILSDFADRRLFALRIDNGADFIDEWHRVVIISNLTWKEVRYQKTCPQSFITIVRLDNSATIPHRVGLPGCTFRPEELKNLERSAAPLVRFRFARSR